MQKGSEKIKKLKKEYSKFVKKYKLPSFDELNKEFEIEEIKLGSFLLRKIRRCMTGKILFYINELDYLLLPTKPSTIFIAKKIKDKEKINKIMKELVTLVTKDIFTNEIEYNEKNEAEIIKEIFNKWKEIKKDLKEIGKAILKEIGEKKELSYLG